MQLFYCNNVQDNSATLNEEESRHAVKSLRMKVGDNIHFVDGNGTFYNARITVADHKHCELQIRDTQAKFNKRNHHLHIAISPTKNTNRFEWFLEKATEIGLDEITPLLCQNSERGTINPDRLQKVLISAMKQSQQAYLPKLNPIVKFTEFLSNDQQGLCMVAHCSKGNRRSIADCYEKEQRVTILIGPEGDFSDQEIQLAMKNNYIPISLGNNRLRTETAGVVSCHTVNLLNQ